MGSSTICKYIHFITIFTIVSGFKHELNNPTFKRSKGLQDTMTDLTHYPGLQYFPTRNTKRMTMDENARTRGAWGQINPQYYQNPMQPQYQNQYYQNMQGQNQYYTPTTDFPPTSTGGAVINIYKQMDGKGQPSGQKAKGNGHVSPSGKPDQRESFSGGEYDSSRPGDSGSHFGIDGKKKVKVLICKLHQGQN